MQRYSLNLKGGSYTQGPMYSLVPIVRQQVVPGQTVDLEIQASIKTAALTKNISTPALASVWFFYVPHRLVWDGWMDFLSKEDGGPSFPTTNTKSDAFFDKADPLLGNVNPLYRRAYKLVYNEYFGTEKIGASYNAWYDDVTDDTNVVLYNTRNPEQFASRLVLDATVVDPEFTVTASQIPLNDFYRQMMNARSQQRSQMSGNKYVDTLARMGVDASWMIAERPEFLGTKSKLVGPVLTANTSATNLGQEAARFQAKIDCNIKQKHFAEHGYIIGVASIRPILFFEDRGAQDMYPTGTTWIDTFYSADNLDTKDKAFHANNGGMTTDAWSQRFAYAKNGTWLLGTTNSNPWVIEQTVTSFERQIYPDYTGLPVGDELGGGQTAFTTEVSVKGRTPIPQRIA